MRCVAPKESVQKRIAINPYAQPRAHRGMFGKRVDLSEWMECMFSFFLFVCRSFYVCGLQCIVNFLEVQYINPPLEKKLHISILQKRKEESLDAYDPVINTVLQY